MSESGAGAAALLPVATSLDTFLTAVRVVRPAPPGATSGPVAGGGVAFAPGDLGEYVARAMDVLNRTPLSNLNNALETLDVAQHSLGYSAVSSA